MEKDIKAVRFTCPSEYDTVEIYPIHDIHYGNECFDAKKWERLKAHILNAPNRYVIWLGDIMECAVPGSKSDMFTQTAPPGEQREWVWRQFRDLKDRTVLILDGNHEHNRATRNAGLYPLYDAACIAGIPEAYRSAYGVADIAVGSGYAGHTNRAVRYNLFCTHMARVLKSFSDADTIDNIDMYLFGHDHDPKDHPTSKLVYDARHGTVIQKNVEVVNCGSFLKYGGYGARGKYRPLSDRTYYIVLHGGRTKRYEVVGFDVNSL